MSQARAPAHCANCGAEIPPKAEACPECGADDRTGWREQSVYDGLDLPEEAYDSEPRGERRGAHRPIGKSKARFWWLVALLLLALVVGQELFTRFGGAR